jgi:NADPH:quinone reductase-like Zn-dependent oxidoreductase
MQAIAAPGYGPLAVAAAAATTGLTAIQSLRDLGRLPAAGDEVVVTGVSGAVGSMSIGVARKLGAWVTAVGSGMGLDLARRFAQLQRAGGRVAVQVADGF